MERPDKPQLSLDQRSTDRDTITIRSKMVAYTTLFLCSLVGVACVAVLHILQTAYRKGIRNVPGPWVAKFSILYRLSLVIKGRAPEEYGALHAKYGDVVRVGPNHVSLNDPAAVPQVYGISSKFGKVSPGKRIALNFD